ncbi:unnamed protein product [Peronospora farinosa]|uniref:RxLR effector protein n=1 Tax=Peronospora farinosa TaxID=134698 RepID=A0AAV0UJ21_9STRA|nr:unnamed protein product [Peronospora farinosa]
MMLLVFFALVAWSAVSVASAMREDTMRTTYDYASLNTTHFDLNVSMRSSNFDDTLEERTKDIGDILKSFQSDMFESLEGLDKQDKLSLFNNVKVRVFKLTPDKLTNSWLAQFRISLAELYETSIHVVDKAIFELVAHKLKNDHALASALVLKKNKVGKEGEAKKLLASQIKKWIKDGQSQADVFKLLQLDQPKKNPFTNPIFSQWLAFVKTKYSVLKAKSNASTNKKARNKRNKKMLNVLEKHYKGDDLTDFLVVGAKSGIGPSKHLARSLLDYRIAKWVHDDCNGAPSDYTDYSIVYFH